MFLCWLCVVGLSLPVDREMSDFPLNPLVLIGAGSSFAFSALFYHLYKEKKQELKKLQASSF